MVSSSCSLATKLAGDSAWPPAVDDQGRACPVHAGPATYLCGHCLPLRNEHVACVLEAHEVKCGFAALSHVKGQSRTRQGRRAQVLRVLTAAQLAGALLPRLPHPAHPGPGPLPLKKHDIVNCGPIMFQSVTASVRGSLAALCPSGEFLPVPRAEASPWPQTTEAGPSAEAPGGTRAQRCKPPTVQPFPVTQETETDRSVVESRPGSPAGPWPRHVAEQHGPAGPGGLFGASLLATGRSQSLMEEAPLSFLTHPSYPDRELHVARTFPDKATC